MLVTCDDFSALRQTVAHLRRQTMREGIEVVLVCPSLDRLALDETTLAGFAGWRIVQIGRIPAIATAYAHGIRAASAPVVALGEDHSFPDPNWAEALLRSHGEPYAAVGPLVCNANPFNSISWADMLLGYGPWLNPDGGGVCNHLPGHNSSYKRDVLLEYGERLDEMLEAETVLHWDLRRRGYVLFHDASARTRHTNFALLKPWTVAQFCTGRCFAASRATSWSIAKRALYAAASPLIPIVRFRRLLSHAWQCRETRPRLLWLLPAMIYAVVIDGIGQLVGYSLGAGGAKEQLRELEFRRDRFILPDDRRRLFDDAIAAAIHAG
ncbi:MAG: glycosyltransferase family 2 protein [Tepidisphaeraceae bacterium]